MSEAPIAPHSSMETTAPLERRVEPMLRVDELVVAFRGAGRLAMQAVAGISFDVASGEALGLVGESGCGKSTTGRAIVGLSPVASGSITFGGRDLTTLSPRELRRERADLQMIFQDPISSLNPNRTVLQLVEQPLVIHRRGTKQERRARAREMLETVGLDPDAIGDRKPTQLSGGQCQRVSIARALMLEPRLLICDEAVSSLDVSVQAQIINLIEDLRQRFGLTMVFIGHDLAVVRAVSDRIAVMYLGKLCELGPSVDVSERPLHPYTALLQRSVPTGAREFLTDAIEDSIEMPSPYAPPSGCRFRTRCPYAHERCASEVPELREVQPGHLVACHAPLGTEGPTITDR